MIDTAGIVERARARGLAHAAGPAPRAPTATRHVDNGPVTTREKAIAKLADDMRDIAGVAGSVDEAALVNRGWTADAIAKYGPEARTIANRAAVRRS